jgi:mannonate dehydratase
VAEKLAPRVHFAHLRNVCRDGNLNFEETHLLEGHVDMTRVMTALVKEDLRRMQEDKSHTGIPVRPDHGAKILGDYGRKTYPGYSLYGRMKSLAEIRGLELGIRHMLESGQSR